ncbi:efflux RND transporter periplasmic adaptor subunit [Planctomycetota bacterium]|nr:efflux RND transporter periplasmic adaptor subunit [Planctomycetota bacterium]
MNDQPQQSPPPDNKPDPLKPKSPILVRILKLGIGPLIGIVFVAIAILALLFYNPKPKAEPRIQATRPAKLLTLGQPTQANLLTFPGRVKAGQSVDLAFQVTGQIIDLPAMQGDELEKGQLIAQLDPRDFENNLAKAEANLQAADIKQKQIAQLVQRKAATQVELINANAQLQSARATVHIEQKALDDTTLTAPFAGVVARKFVDNFQNIQAKETIISLQNITQAEIIVDIPETVVARGNKDEKPETMYATFDFIPDQQFPLTMKEYQSEANPITQTYEVTFVMPNPKDFLLLPGMSTTVHIAPPDSSKMKPELGFAVPISAIFKQGDQSFVWLVNPETKAVSQQPVSISNLSAENAIVTEGLNTGDTIVTTGASQLHPGQTVRQFDSNEFGT